MISRDDQTPEDRRQDAIDDAKTHAKPKGLTLPLSAEDNRPIWDAAGQLVSVHEHAGAFTHAMNMHQRMLDLLAATQIPLLNAIVCMSEGNAKQNTQRLLDDIKKAVVFARAGARLARAEEAAEADVLGAIVDAYDDREPTASVLAKAVKTKFRVYAR
ncbi:MAG: hypothetical protein WCP82_05050 [Alphaproteobacteria bacterium]